MAKNTKQTPEDLIAKLERENKALNDMVSKGNIRRQECRLPIDTEKVYELVDWIGGAKQNFGRRFGTIDVSILTVRDCDRLLAKGFHKLCKK